MQQPTFSGSSSIPLADGDASRARRHRVAAACRALGLVIDHKSWFRLLRAIEREDAA